MSTATKPLSGRRMRNDEYKTIYADLEKWLISWGVSYAFQQISVERIDLARSMKNQARIGEPIDREVVERYTNAMADGDEFPPVVVHRTREGYIVIDGNHRAHAAIGARLDQLPAFVIEDATAMAITGMTFEANVRHGKNVTETERIHHALWMVDNGMSLQEAGRRLALPAAALRRARQEIEANRRADAAGVDRRQWDAIPPTARVRLCNVSTDEGFLALTKLTVEAALGVTVLFNVVSQMNDSKSASKQVAIVAQLREEYADRIAANRVGGADNIKGIRSRAPKASWSSALGFAAAVPPIRSVIESTSPSEREEMLAKVQKTIAMLTEAASELEAAR